MAKTNELVFGIKNVKYAVKTAGTYGTPADMAFAHEMSLEPIFQTQNVYGDGQLMAVLASDKGQQGNLILKQPALDYEVAMGRKLALDKGNSAAVEQQDQVEHAIYFEYESMTDGVKSTKKVWLLNVVSGRPTEAFTQTEDQVVVNNIEIPITILGELLKASGGSSDYVDANGNKKKVWSITAKPGDDNYTTFASAVPSPALPAGD